jgi:hypothetical protein
VGLPINAALLCSRALNRIIMRTLLALLQIVGLWDGNVDFLIKMIAGKVEVVAERKASAPTKIVVVDLFAQVYTRSVY